MLKGIPTEISPELLFALAEMGHGDLLAIVDDFYPAISKTPNGQVIYAKGNGAGEMIDAILKLFPLDVEYCEHPVEYMVPDAGSGVVMEGSKAWDDAIAAVKNNGYEESAVGTIERSKFYEKAGKAQVTVSTSERLPYGCFILQKGVM